MPKSPPQHPCTIIHSPTTQLPSIDKAVLHSSDRFGSATRPDVSSLVFQPDNVLSGQLMAPITLLPTEILQEIFWNTYTDYYALNFNIPQTDRGCLDSTKPPLIFLQVSKHWRQTALSHPKLWSRVQIDLDKFSPSRPQRRAISRLSKQISRAKEYPLSLEIRSNRFTGDHPLLNLLLKVSEKWESARLHLTPPFAQLVNHRKGSFPLLRFLEWDFNNGWEDPHYDYPTLDAFEDAPRLQSLQFLHVQRPVPFERLRFPWRQLTSFGVWSGGGAAIKYSLPLLTNVTACELINCAELDMTDFTPQSTRLHLPYLKRFHYSRALHSDLVKKFHIPALQELQIDTVGENQAMPFAEICHFSRFSLTKLILSYVECDPHDIIAILHHVPSLTILEATFSPMCFAAIDTMAEALTLRTSFNPLLPNLHSLLLMNSALDCLEPACPDADLLVTMVESRWCIHRRSLPSTSHQPTCSLLRRIIIRHLGYWSVWNVDRLLQLARQGLVIELSGWLEDDCFTFGRSQPLRQII